MNRCAPICTPARPASRRAPPAALALMALTSLLAALSAPALAQAPRQFPANALRGVLVVTAPPEITINGTAARLSPGSRIWGNNNLLQLSGGLVDQKLVVNYTYDFLGQVQQVWILRDDEAANKPWPRTAEQAASWSFDLQAQTWTINGSTATTGRH